MYLQIIICLHIHLNTVVCTVIPRLICQREISGKLTWLSGKSPYWVRNRYSWWNFPLPSKDWRACPPVCHESVPAKEFCNLSNPYHSCDDCPSHTSKANWMKHGLFRIELLDLTLSGSISAIEYHFNAHVSWKKSPPSAQFVCAQARYRRSFSPQGKQH